MKKNGFTLIEIIITIALLGLVGIVLSISMINLIDNQKSNKIEEFKMLMEDAACTYAVLLGDDFPPYIHGNDLVAEGLIEEEVNGFKSDDYGVNVKVIDGERICTFDGEVLK